MHGKDRQEKPAQTIFKSLIHNNLQLLEACHHVVVKTITTNNRIETKPVQTVKIAVSAAQQISVIFIAEATFTISICLGKIITKQATESSTNAERKSAGENKSAGKVLFGDKCNCQ